MSKVVLRCNKIKTKSQLTGMYEHNFRIDHCENIDKTQTYKNEELISMEDGSTYKDKLRERIRQSEYYKDNKVRKNAVLALDVQIGFGQLDKTSPDFDLEKWKEKSVKWAQNTFGKENVISMVLHMDESSPHIHALIIPMKDEKLNAKSFIGSPDKLRQMQDSIGETMSELGLERGTKRSVATHTEIQEFYGAMKEAASEKLPECREGESAEAYRIRAQAAHKKSRLQDFGKIKELEAENASLKGINKSTQEIEKENEQLKKEISRMAKGQQKIDLLIYAINNNLPDVKTAQQFFSDMKKMTTLAQQQQQKSK